MLHRSSRHLRRGRRLLRRTAEAVAAAFSSKRPRRLELEALEPRVLLTTFYGGETFQYVAADPLNPFGQGPLVRVTLTGEIIAEFIAGDIDTSLPVGAFGGPVAQQIVLGELPSTILASPYGRAGQEILGGTGGGDGVTPIGNTPITETGTGATTGSPGGLLLPGDAAAININGIASGPANVNFQTYGFNVGPVQFSPQQSVNAVQVLNIDNADGDASVITTLHQATLGDEAPVPLIGAGGALTVTGLAAHPATGLLYAIQGSNLFEINRLSGNVTDLGPIRNTAPVGGGGPAAIGAVGALAFDANGNLHVLTQDYDTTGDGSGKVTQTIVNPGDPTNGIPPAFIDRTSTVDVAIINLGDPNGGAFALDFDPNAAGVVRSVMHQLPVVTVDGAPFVDDTGQFVVGIFESTLTYTGMAFDPTDATGNRVWVTSANNQIDTTNQVTRVGTYLERIQIDQPGAADEVLSLDRTAIMTDAGEVRIDGLTFSQVLDEDGNRFNDLRLFGVNNGLQGGPTSMVQINLNMPDMSIAVTPDNGVIGNVMGLTSFDPDGFEANGAGGPIKPLLYALDGLNIHTGSTIFLPLAEGGVETSITAIDAASFRPLDGSAEQGQLYFIARGGANDTDELYRIDVAAGSRAQIQNSLAVVTAAAIGQNDQFTSIAWKPDGSDLYGFNAGAQNTPQLVPILGAGPATTPVIVGTPIGNVTGIEFFPTDPDPNAIMVITADGAASQLYRVRLDVGNTIFNTNVYSFGSIVDPDDVTAPILGQNFQGLTFNPGVISPFTGQPGVYLALDPSSDQLAAIDIRPRFPAADVYSIYVTHAGVDATIAVSIVDPATGLLTPFQGPTVQPLNFVVENANNRLLLVITQDANTGGVLLGTRQEDLDTSPGFSGPNEESRRPVIFSSVNHSPLTNLYFGPQLGTRPGGIDEVPITLDPPTPAAPGGRFDVAAGLHAPASLEELVSPALALVGKLLNLNLDIIQGLAVSRDGTIAAVDADRVDSMGNRLIGNEVALISPLGAGISVTNIFDATTGVAIGNIQGLDYADINFDGIPGFGATVATSGQDLYAILDVDSPIPNIAAPLGNLGGDFDIQALGSDASGNLFAANNNLGVLELIIIGRDVNGNVTGIATDQFGRALRGSITLADGTAVEGISALEVIPGVGLVGVGTAAGLNGGAPTLLRILQTLNDTDQDGVEAEFVAVAAAGAALGITDQVTGLAVNPATGTLFAVARDEGVLANPFDDADVLYTINLGTGVATEVGGAGMGQVQINLSGSALSPSRSVGGDLGGDFGVFGVAVDTDSNQVFIISDNGGGGFMLDEVIRGGANGEVTAVNNAIATISDGGAVQNINAADFDSANDLIYVVGNTAGGMLTLYELDPGGGTTTNLGELDQGGLGVTFDPATNSVTAIAFDEATNTLFAVLRNALTGADQLVTIATDGSGVVTVVGEVQVGGVPAQINGMDFDAAGNLRAFDDSQLAVSGRRVVNLNVVDPTQSAALTNPNLVPIDATLNDFSIDAAGTSFGVPLNGAGNEELFNSFNTTTITGMDFDRNGLLTAINDPTGAGNASSIQFSILTNPLNPDSIDPSMAVEVTGPGTVADDLRGYGSDANGIFYSINGAASPDEVVASDGLAPTLGVIDPTTGAFTRVARIDPLGLAPIPITNVAAMAFHPNEMTGGDYIPDGVQDLFIIDSNGNVYQIDPRDGNVVNGYGGNTITDALATPLNPIPVLIGSMDFDSSGVLHAHELLQGRVVDIDLRTLTLFGGEPIIIGAVIDTADGSLNPTVGAISYAFLQDQFLGVENATGLLDLGAGEAPGGIPVPESAALIRLIERQFVDAAGNVQNLGLLPVGQTISDFMFAGTIIGRVHTDGSFGRFYAGWLLTGLTDGEFNGVPPVLVGPTGIASSLPSFGPAIPNNFFVGGDIRDLIVADSIGSDGAGTPYFSGFDMQVRGKAGQIWTLADFVGQVGSDNLQSVSGISIQQLQLFEFEQRRPSPIDPNGEAAFGSLNQPGQHVLWRRDLPFYNDTFQTAQRLGSVRSGVVGQPDTIQIGGVIQNTAVAMDEVDYFSVSLLAGQTIIVQLIPLGLPLNVGIFDPDNRLVATDYDNLDPASVTSQPFKFTADRPGEHRFAVTLPNNPTFVPVGQVLPTVRPYNLIIQDPGDIAIGALRANGNVAGPGTTLNSATLDVSRGDMGAIAVTGTLDSAALVDVQVLNGSFRSADIGTFGSFVTNVPQGHIGLLQQRNAGLMALTLISLGGDMQVIEGGLSNVGVTLQAGGGLGMLRALDMNTQPASVISVDFNRQGNDGTIDLIDVSGIFGGPIIDTGGRGGNVRFIRVGGDVLGPGGGGAPIAIPVQIGRNFTFTDDGGGQYEITPIDRFGLGENETDPTTSTAQLIVRPYPVGNALTGGGIVMVDIASTGGMKIDDITAHGNRGPAEIGRITIGVVDDITNGGLGNFQFDFDAFTLAGGRTVENQDPLDPTSPLILNPVFVDNLSVGIHGPVPVDIFEIVGPNISSIANTTGGDIVSVFATSVGSLYSHGNIGVTRTGTSAALVGNVNNATAFFPTQNAFPFLQQSTGVVVVTDIIEVKADQGVGNVVTLLGSIGRLIANADRVNVPGVFEGINGPISAGDINNITFGFGDIRVVDIGEGVLPSGTGNLSRAGLYATGEIRRVFNSVPADIRGDITGRLGVHVVELHNGSLINNEVGAIFNPDATREFSGLNAAELEFDSVFNTINDIRRISITGNGGIIGSIVVAPDIGDITVSKSGFGIFNSAFATLVDGNIGDTTAGGFGIRGVTFIAGPLQGDIIATGNGELLNVFNYSESVRASENFVFDPFTGQLVSALTDLHVFMGTSAATPVLPDVTNSGIIQNISASGLLRLGDVRAFRIEGGLVPSSITYGSSIQSIRTIDTISDLEVATGVLHTFAPGSDVSALSLAVSGRLNKIDINGDLLEGSTITAGGLNGSIGSVNIRGDLDGTLVSAGNIGTITIGGDLDGSIIILGQNVKGQSLKSMTLGGSLLDGGLNVTGDVGKLDFRQSVGGSRDSQDLIVIQGNLKSIKVGGDRTTDGHVLAASLVVLGDLGTLDVNGKVEGDIFVTGNTGTIKIVNDASTGRGNAPNPTFNVGALRSNNRGDFDVQALAVHPDQVTTFAVNHSGTTLDLYTIERLLNGVVDGSQGDTFTPLGQIYVGMNAVLDIRAMDADPITGLLNMIGVTANNLAPGVTVGGSLGAAGVPVTGLTINTVSNTAFVTLDAGGGAASLTRIDRNAMGMVTGLTAIGGGNINVGGTDILFISTLEHNSSNQGTTGLLVVGDGGSGNLELFSVNETTGAATSLGVLTDAVGANFAAGTAAGQFTVVGLAYDDRGTPTDNRDDRLYAALRDVDAGEDRLVRISLDGAALVNDTFGAIQVNGVNAVIGGMDLREGRLLAYDTAAMHAMIGIDMANAGTSRALTGADPLIMAGLGLNGFTVDANGNVFSILDNSSLGGPLDLMVTGTSVHDLFTIDGATAQAGAVDENGDGVLAEVAATALFAGNPAGGLDDIAAGVTGETNDFVALAFTPDGSRLFAVMNNGGVHELVVIDELTGQLIDPTGAGTNQVAVGGAGSTIRGADFGNDGSLFAIDDTPVILQNGNQIIGKIIRIDTAAPAMSTNVTEEGTVSRALRGYSIDFNDYALSVNDGDAVQNQLWRSNLNLVDGRINVGGALKTLTVTGGNVGGGGVITGGAIGKATITGGDLSLGVSLASALSNIGSVTIKNGDLDGMIRTPNGSISKVAVSGVGANMGFLASVSALTVGSFSLAGSMQDSSVLNPVDPSGASINVTHMLGKLTVNGFVSQAASILAGAMKTVSFGSHMAGSLVVGDDGQTDTKLTVGGDMLGTARFAGNVSAAVRGAFGPTSVITHAEGDDTGGVLTANATIDVDNAIFGAAGGSLLGRTARVTAMIGDNAGANDDMDIYRLDNLVVGQAITVAVNATMGSAADPIVGVYDVNGNLIAMDDNSGGGVNALLTVAAPTDGTFFVVIAGAQAGAIPDPFALTAGGAAVAGGYEAAMSVGPINQATLGVGGDLASFASRGVFNGNIFVDGQGGKIAVQDILDAVVTVGFDLQSFAAADVRELLLQTGLGRGVDGIFASGDFGEGARLSVLKSFKADTLLNSVIGSGGAIDTFNVGTSTMMSTVSSGFVVGGSGVNRVMLDSTDPMHLDLSVTADQNALRGAADRALFHGNVGKAALGMVTMSTVTAGVDPGANGLFEGVAGGSDDSVVTAGVSRTGGTSAILTLDADLGGGGGAVAIADSTINDKSGLFAATAGFFDAAAQLGGMTFLSAITAANPLPAGTLGPFPDGRVAYPTISGVVTIELKGPGTFTIVDEGAAVDTDGVIDAIVLNGTTDKSSLKITTTDPTGSRIGRLLAGTNNATVKSLEAEDIDFVGDGSNAAVDLWLDGAVNDIMVRTTAANMAALTSDSNWQGRVGGDVKDLLITTLGPGRMLVGGAIKSAEIAMSIGTTFFSPLAAAPIGAATLSANLLELTVDSLGNSFVFDEATGLAQVNVNAGGIVGIGGPITVTDQFSGERLLLKGLDADEINGAAPRLLAVAEMSTFIPSRQVGSFFPGTTVTVRGIAVDSSQDLDGDGVNDDRVLGVYTADTNGDTVPDTDQLVQFDSNTGAITVIGTIVTPSSQRYNGHVQQLAFDRAGNLNALVTDRDGIGLAFTEANGAALVRIESRDLNGDKLVFTSSPLNPAAPFVGLNFSGPVVAGGVAQRYELAGMAVNAAGAIHAVFRDVTVVPHTQDILVTIALNGLVTAVGGGTGQIIVPDLIDAGDNAAGDTNLVGIGFDPAGNLIGFNNDPNVNAPNGSAELLNLNLANPSMSSLSSGQTSQNTAIDAFAIGYTGAPFNSYAIDTDVLGGLLFSSPGATSPLAGDLRPQNVVGHVPGIGNALGGLGGDLDIRGIGASPLLDGATGFNRLFVADMVGANFALKEIVRGGPGGQVSAINTVGTIETGDGTDILGIRTMAVNSLGVLYTIGTAGPAGVQQNLVVVNTNTGAAGTVLLRDIGGNPITQTFSGMAFHPVTGTLFAVRDDAAGGQSLFNVNTATGIATNLGRITVGALPTDINGIAFDAANRLIGFDDSAGGRRIVTINTANPGASVQISLRNDVNANLGDLASINGVFFSIYDDNTVNSQLWSTGLANRASVLGIVFTGDDPATPTVEAAGDFLQLQPLSADATGAPVNSRVLSIAVDNAVGSATAGNVFVVTADRRLLQYDGNGNFIAAPGSIASVGTNVPLNVTAIDFNDAAGGAAGVQLVGVDARFNQLVDLNIATAVATPITEAGSVGGQDIISIAFDPDGPGGGAAARFIGFSADNLAFTQFVGTTQASLGGLEAHAIDKLEAGVVGMTFDGRVAVTGDVFKSAAIIGNFTGTIISNGDLDKFSLQNGDLNGTVRAADNIKSADVKNGDVLGGGVVQAGGELTKFSTKGGAMSPGDVAGRIVANSARSIAIDGAALDSADIQIINDAGSVSVNGSFEGFAQFGSAGKIGIGSMLSATGALNVDRDVKSVAIDGGTVLGGVVNILGSAGTVTVGGDHTAVISVRGALSKAVFNTVTRGLLAVGLDTGSITTRGDVIDSVFTTGVWIGNDRTYNTADDEIRGGSVGKVSIGNDFVDSVIAAGVLPDINTAVNPDTPNLPLDNRSYSGSNAFPVLNARNEIDSAEAGGVLPSRIGGFQARGEIIQTDPGVAKVLNPVTFQEELQVVPNAVGRAAVLAAADAITKVKADGVFPIVQRVYGDPFGPVQVVSNSIVSDSRVDIIFSEEIDTSSIVLAVDLNNDGDTDDLIDTRGTVRIVDQNGVIIDSNIELVYSTRIDPISGNKQGVLSLIRQGGFGNTDLFVTLSGGEGDTLAITDRSSGRSLLRNFPVSGVPGALEAAFHGGTAATVFGQDPFGSLLDGDRDGVEGGNRTVIAFFADAPDAFANTGFGMDPLARPSALDAVDLRTLMNFDANGVGRIQVGNSLNLITDIDIFRFTANAFEFLSVNYEGEAAVQIGVFMQDTQGTPLTTLDDTFELLGRWESNVLDPFGPVLDDILFQAFELPPAEDGLGFLTTNINFFILITPDISAFDLGVNNNYTLNITISPNDDLLDGTLDGFVTLPEDEQILYISNEIGDANNLLGAQPPKQLVYLNFGGGISTRTAEGTVRFQPFDTGVLDPTIRGFNNVMIQGGVVGGVRIVGILENLNAIFTTTPATHPAGALNVQFLGSDLSTFNLATEGLFFTTVDPSVSNALDSTADFTTVFVGQSNKRILDSYGLAETVDFGNLNKAEEVIVPTEAFTGESVSPTLAVRLNEYSRAIANVIAHELGHAMGLVHHGSLLEGNSLYPHFLGGHPFPDDPDNNPLTPDDSNQAPDISVLGSGDSAAPGELVASLQLLGTAPLEPLEFVLGDQDTVDLLLRWLK